MGAVSFIGLAVLGGLMFELHERRRVERLERLNEESWAVLHAARRIHDEAAQALEAMLAAVQSPELEPPERPAS
jgi:hypothetical protein